MIPPITLSEIEKTVPDQQIQRMIRVYIRKAFREAWSEMLEKSDIKQTGLHKAKVTLLDVRRVLKIIL